MIIAIGSDHTALDLKKRIIAHLQGKGMEVFDKGTYDDKPTDYPVYAKEVCNTVIDGGVEFGILICGTGIGMSIVANKIKGIRCALCNDPYSARMAKEHNNANIIAFGTRVIGYGVAIDIVDAFLAAEYDPRHQARLDMVTELE